MTDNVSYQATEYTVAVICAMGFEMSAFRYMFDHEHEIHHDESTIYTLGDVHGLNVVLGCLSGQQGKGAAAIVAANMSHTFPNIKWRLLVGIGGGIPSDSHDIRLGDVVVSMPRGEHGGVVQYDLGKSTDAGFIRKGFLYPPPQLLRSAVERMDSDHLVRNNKITEILEKMICKGPGLARYRRPSAVDILYHDGSASGNALSSAEVSSSTIDTRRKRDPPGVCIHYGLIASGDSVIRSSMKRSEMVRELGDILCFEMEAAGPMTAYPCTVIRGISDYADSHKNDDWRNYAAATAAACAIELLSYVASRTSTGQPPLPAESSESESSPRQPLAIEWHKQPNYLRQSRGIMNTGKGRVTIGGDSNIS